MKYNNIYFITGTAYAGKSTLAKYLANKYEAILCGENYHDEYFNELDPKEFPNLNYTRNLLDWHDFIRRTPNEYEAWVDGVSKECEKLELIILDNLSKTNKLIFVDTNISLDTLKKITDPSHVLIMLADPSISVSRFFERPDREKQFLYKLIMEEKDPNFALNNFRECLSKINSIEKYYYFLNSGFNVILRDENRTIEETSMIAEKYFQLK